MSPGTVRNIRTFISGVFTQAVEDGLLAVNPAQQLGRFLPRCPDRKAHIRALTREQVKAVLDAAAELYPDYYPLVLCGFRTGMRMGELLGLAWEDVDFEGKCINLRRSWSHNRFSTPKTHKGRVVDLSDQLARVLLDHRQALLLKFKGKLRAVPVPAGMAEGESINVVFPYFTGRQIDPSWFRRVAWRRLFEKANVPQVRIHDMRHTFASLLLQQGESLHYVKEQLGHSSIQTTVDVYGHLAPGSNRNAVNKLDDPVAPLRVAAAG
ncbi:MAG: site-specific integrase [Planctomycetota bacterium]|nr:site-specific integrase [Planctomycetota bacterium]